jgi:GNAT superfamily N-acetyltransferase
MPDTSAHLRTIRSDELPSLLALYRHLHPSDPKLSVGPDLEALWQKICNDPLLHYFGAELDGALVSTCTLAIIPNLTRSARPYGLVENVVTHPEFRRQGIATALLRFTLRFAWDQGCYKVMLLTGRQDPATLRFYEHAGFQAGVKTGFIALP